jgi:hypothetical protein
MLIEVDEHEVAKIVNLLEADAEDCQIQRDAARILCNPIEVQHWGNQAELSRATADKFREAAWIAEIV